MTGIPGGPMGEGPFAGQQGGYGNAAGSLDYDGASGRGGRGSRGGRGTARGSGRGGRGGGRGGARRRRADEDAFYTPPGTSIAAELMRTGSGGLNGGPGMLAVGGSLNAGLAVNLPHAANNAAAAAAGGGGGFGALDDRPVKRRRRTLSAGGGPDGRRWVCSCV